ncbi:MAG: hypothetical protein GWP56_15605 [Gammaproteobacteria bacterium]|nr:hypothetical protein [Gammaproteobacteria bacterium]
MTETDQQVLQALQNTRFTTYWLDSLDAVGDEAALERDIDCDLLVVGGGFCGLWAALQAKQQRALPTAPAGGRPQSCRPR